VPQPEAARRSASRLNSLAHALNASSYLEVGVWRGDTFLGIDAPERIGVDPNFQFDTSAYADDHTRFVASTFDSFFAELGPEVFFDLVFLDGLHTFEQTYRDLCSALLHSHPRTVILVDDTVPVDIYSSLPTHAKTLRWRKRSGSDSLAWHGDVNKVVLAIRDFHVGLEYRTITGSGNPQTLVWRSHAIERVPAFHTFEAISRATWFDLMDNFQLLQPCNEREAIDLCVSAMAIDADNAG
jgi:hypothetical protein